MKDFLRNNGVLILIIAVLLTLIVAVTSALMGGVADPLSNLVGIVTTPVRNGVNAVANWTEEQYQRLFLQDQMQAEYEQLKRDYAKLEELRATPRKMSACAICWACGRSGGTLFLSRLRSPPTAPPTGIPPSCSARAALWA